MINHPCNAGKVASRQRARHAVVQSKPSCSRMWFHRARPLCWDRSRAA